MRPSKILLYICVLALALTTSIGGAQATEPKQTSNGQTVYVPVYSHVYSGNRALPFNLASMLSIRNTSLIHPIELLSIDYYDNDGKLLKTYLQQPMKLNALASHHVFIKENDETGGFGANFIVRWRANKEVNTPLIETIMIGTKSGQGISFLTPGRVVGGDSK